MRFKAPLLLFLPISVALISLCIGGYETTWREVFGVLLGIQNDEMLRGVLLEVRLPRILGAIIVGGGLSVCGAVFQGIFKNPLADPYTLGVSNGAGFGAALGIVASFGVFATQMSALLGGLLAVFGTFLLSNFKGKSFHLILSGLLISSLFASFLALLKFLADPFEQLPQIVFWLLGSLTQISYERLAWILPGFLIGLGVLFAYSHRINVMSLGEDEARSFGIDVQRDRKILIFLCSLVTALLVSISGVIGWVGVLIPHLARLMSGADFRGLFLSCFSFGATYMLIVDTLARSVSSSEIPVGVITGIVGIILFFFLVGYDENRD